ncbi:hypothetical protein BX616_002715 [Lobosporangium transversale]|nr:hypothetical protein BX616_002715 [Lobosporangium transversale]
MAPKNVFSPEAVEQGLYIAYTALSVMAINPDSRKRILKRQIDESGEDDDMQEDTPSEVLSSRGAYSLPLFGPALLYGLNLAYTHWNRTYINYVISAYFVLLSVFAFTQAGVNTFDGIANLLGIRVDSFYVTLAKRSKAAVPLEFYSARFTIIHTAMLMGSILLSGYYVATRHWIVSNILAISLGLSAIQTLTLDSFKSGMTLLINFLLHDSFLMYGSDMLVSVTKSIDFIPIRITFPRLLSGLLVDGQTYFRDEFVVLNLGDIVIPGLFVALCLHFDQYRSGIKNHELGRSTNFRKPYFIACIIAYILGLGVSFYIMHATRNTYPTLLFLVPACILSVIMTASVRGEMRQVFAFVTEEGLEAIRIKKEALNRKRRRVQTTRYASRG